MRKPRADGDVLHAVALFIKATFTNDDWHRLGLITNTLSLIRDHPRLLRSLSFGDDDYLGNIAQVLPIILGDANGRHPLTGTRYPNFAPINDAFKIQSWLRSNEGELYQRLYGPDTDSATIELENVAKHLGVPEIEIMAGRIRRGLREDPALAVGASKDLLESVMKGVLGLHGNGPETKLSIPQLVHLVGRKLDIDPGGSRAALPGAQHERKVLSALNQIVTAAAEMRNAGFGAGHGGSRQDQFDIATARLVVSAAVAVATFYVELAENL